MDRSAQPGNPQPMPQRLDLFPIGNCAASALIDRAGRRRMEAHVLFRSLNLP